MFGTSGGGHAAQRTMRDLRRAVMLMGAKERADNVVVGVPTLKTNWRKRPEREVEGPPKRRKPRMKEVVLPPVEAKAVVEKELSEYAFLDANKQEETEWKGPSRPMQDLWQDRWTEMRYLWERLRTAFGADALVLGTKLQATVGVGKLERFSMIRSLLVADKICWTRAISQRFFTGEFTNYLSADPFSVVPHLTRLWKALDVEEKGTIDFRELACLLRVLTHPEEAPQDKFMFFFDVYRQRLPTGMIKPYMMRQFLLFILGLPAGSEEDARALIATLPEVERALRYPVPRAIHREKMLIALDHCPNAMATFRRCCLARLPRSRRLRALAHDASRTSDNSHWAEKSAFQARLRAAEAHAHALGLPSTHFKVRLGRSRRHSTASVALPPVKEVPQASAARAFGVPETLLSAPREPLDECEGSEAARLARQLYSTDKNEVLQARVRPRAGAEINNLKTIAYSTMGTIAAMRGLTMVKLRLRRAGLCAVLARYPSPEAKKRFIFHHWRKRSQDKIRRLEGQNLAYEYYVNRTMIRYLRWWQFMGRVGAAKKLAVRMHAHKWKKKLFANWRKYVELQELARQHKDMFRDAAVRRLAMKAQLSAADRERLFRKVWLPRVFEAIRAEARYWRVVALAAQYRRWRLLYNQFHSWAFRAKHRREFKDRKRIERKVQRHAESNRREAEEKAQKKAEEAAKRAAKEAAAKEEAWKEKLKKAEAYFDIRRVMEIQKEKADKRRLQAKQAREAKFNAFFDTIVAERYAEVATQADAYLFEEIDGKRAFKMFVDEMTAALFIKEKIDETVERWQSGFHWKLEYEWELLARSFVHKDTGERVYHRKEAGVPKSSRATKDKMKQIARDNFVGRKEFESSKMLAKRRAKELALEHQQVSAIMIQKAWKTCKYSFALRTGLKRLIKQARFDAGVAHEQFRNDMARKIQNAWQARGFQSMLADLVWSLWAIKSDPSDDSIYYMNRLSGAIQTHPPAILRSRLVGNVIRNIDMEPDWILVVVPDHERGVSHYFNPRLKEKRFKPPMGYYMCADCNRYRFATRFCPQCGDHYCLPCYKKQHKKGARANHAWIPIPVKPVYCKNCNRRKALYKCYECAMPLCYDCNVEFHEDTEWYFHDVIDL